MTLPAALESAESTGTPVTVDLGEGVRARARVNEYGERQIAVYTAQGAASEAQAVAAAVQAGFGRWTTDRARAALVLTEVEAAEETEAPVTEAPVGEAPANLQLFPAAPYRPGTRYPDIGPVATRTLYHGLTRDGHLYTVIRYDREHSGWRCDALNVCVTQADRKYHEHFEFWLQGVS